PPTGHGATHPATSSAADGLFCCPTVQLNRSASHIADRRDPWDDHGRQDQDRQQVLDEQADAATTRATGDKRPHNSAYPTQRKAALTGAPRALRAQPTWTGAGVPVCLWSAGRQDSSSGALRATRASP